MNRPFCRNCSSWTLQPIVAQPNLELLESSFSEFGCVWLVFVFRGERFPATLVDHESLFFCNDPERLYKSRNRKAVLSSPSHWFLPAIFDASQL